MMGVRSAGAERHQHGDCFLLPTSCWPCGILLANSSSRVPRGLPSQLMNALPGKTDRYGLSGQVNAQASMLASLPSAKRYRDRAGIICSTPRCRRNLRHQLPSLTSQHARHTTKVFHASQYGMQKRHELLMTTFKEHCIKGDEELVKGMPWDACRGARLRTHAHPLQGRIPGCPGPWLSSATPG